VPVEAQNVIQFSAME